jgi:hypothetical protein
MTPKITFPSTNNLLDNNFNNIANINLLDNKKGALIVSRNSMYLKSSDSETLELSSDSSKYYHNDK